MAAHLGETTALIDVTRGAAGAAAGLEAAAARARLRPRRPRRRRRRRARARRRAGAREPALRRGDARRGSRTSTTLPSLFGVVGPGCDGELTAAEVLDRVAELAAARCLARDLLGEPGRRVGARGRGRRDPDRGEPADRPLRARRGRDGSRSGGGRRHVELSPARRPRLLLRPGRGRRRPAVPLASRGRGRGLDRRRPATRSPPAASAPSSTTSASRAASTSGRTEPARQRTRRRIELRRACGTVARVPDSRGRRGRGRSLGALALARLGRPARSHPGALRPARRRRLPQHPPARAEGSNVNAAQIAAFEANGTLPAARERPDGHVREPALRVARAQALAAPRLLQGRDVRREAGRRRAHLQPARRRHDRARQVRRSAHLRRRPRRDDVRRRLRGRRGPPLLHRRAAQRRRGEPARASRAAPTSAWTSRSGPTRPTTSPTSRGSTTTRRPSTGSAGCCCRRDLQNYLAGINQYIDEACVEPAEDARRVRADRQAQLALHASLPGHRRDLDRLARRRASSARAAAASSPRARLEQLQKRFGAKQGERVWADFRSQNDPEAPTTVHNKPLPYETTPKKVARPGDARPGLGQVPERRQLLERRRSPSTTPRQAAGSRARPPRLAPAA